MADVTFTPNHQPAPACYPNDVNGLLDMLTTGGGLSGTIPDNSGGGIYVGSSPPSSSLTQKVWFVTDAAGRPLGIYMFYNGNWRRVYTGVVYGEIKLYIGGFNGVFDGTGLGIIGGQADGWAVCNGQNGTDNLEGYFPCGAAWNGSAWVTTADDGANWKGAGGIRGPHMIVATTHLPKLSSYVYGSLVAAAGSGAYAVANADKSIVGDWPLLDGNGQPVTGAGQQPIPLPLFIAMCMMMFVGYQ